MLHIPRALLHRIAENKNPISFMLNGSVYD